MKRILIATDFSAAADDAAKYAIALATVIGTDAIITNAALVTTDSPVEILWPKGDYQSLIRKNDIRLGDLSKKLIDSSFEHGGVTVAMPKVTVKSGMGSVVDLLRETVQNGGIGLVAMGLSGSGNMKRLVLGSSSRDVIDSADYPVLLVPKGTVFKPITRIAFATDLSLNDMECIKSLAGLAGLLQAELRIVHVIRPGLDSGVTEHINAFRTQLKNTISYDRIHYENVYCPKVEDGLCWLKDHGETDLLVMVHHRHNGINDFIKGSHSQKMARRTTIPLLIMPEGYHETLC